MNRAADDAAAPLVGRAGDAVLFRLPTRIVTAAVFLAEARRLAERLPDATHVVNLCQDRYSFAVAFAAALIRGQVSLLSGDRSSECLRGFAERFGDVCSVADDGAVASPLPHCLIDRKMPAARPGSAANPAIPVDRLAAIVFTSGSTGDPVGHRKPWGALAVRSVDAGNRFGMQDAAPPVIVGTVPPGHMYGFETTILLPLHAAASVWCGHGFYPSDIRAALAAVPSPRVLVTTPLQIRALLQADVVLPSLQRVISATAPLATELAAAAERRWATEVFEIFGATEVGSIASRRTVVGDEWTAYDQVRFAPAQEGTLVTAPLAEPTQLGDILELLDERRFRLVGRSTDMVKLGGRRASLAGLNRILAAIPGVVDGVFIAPDDLDSRPSARMLAFAIAPDLTAEAILAELRDRIEPVFLPRRVIRVDALPRNELGKLPHAALRALRGQIADG